MLLATLLSGGASAAPDGFFGGHLKYQLEINEVPEESLFSGLTDDRSVDHGSELRLNFGQSLGSVSFDIAYQLVGRRGDTFRLASEFDALPLRSSAIISDEFRLLDLSQTISQQDDRILVQRLDQLWVGVSSERSVIRLGRQAVSWGNGLVYTPMDIFNPFDPASVDKEYKSGDDMLYGQYLRENGDDLQAVWVVRRNQDGAVSGAVDSQALKYHGFTERTEFDLLLAQHYRDNVLGAGAVMSLGGAILQGDLVVTDTSEGTITSLVTNLSWSWLAAGHNVSALMEYFYNGFGQTDRAYAPQQLAQNSALAERLRRGELFTLGRHYLAASALVEMTPLWTLTPNLFMNVSDGSMLLQLLSRLNVRQDWEWLFALNLPIGPSGTEFGGLPTGEDDRYLKIGPGLFMQLAWYF